MTQVYKPGSVLTAIYLALRSLAGSSRLLEAVGQTYCFSTALLRDRVYSVKPMLPWAGWALTPPFHPYVVDLRIQFFRFTASGKAHAVCEISFPHGTRLRWASTGTPLWGTRYISVALVLRSPSAGVTRYPCPMEPGLSSPAAFQLAAAAVQSGRRNIVPQI